MSDRDTPDSSRPESSGEAEPVDAEFEPAPEADAPEPDKPQKKSGGAGPFKVILFVILAAGIGGAAGYALTRYLPAATMSGVDTSDLEARLAALESATPADMSGLTERVARLESAVQARDGLSERVDALAASVERLETAMNAALDAQSGETAGDGAGDADAGPALAALETRIGEAFTQVQERLEGLEADVSAARDEADAARSAAQQANTALSTISSGEDQSGTPSDQRLAALSGRIDALDAALGEMGGALRSLQGLPQRVDALAAQLSDAEGAGASQGAPADAAPQQAVTQLQTRLRTLARDLSGLAERVAALESGAGDTAGGSAPAPEPAGLAARALAFAALSEAASGSQPFAVELAELARVWPDAPGLGALSPVARAGTPTPERLAETFPGDALREATGEMRTYFGVLRVAREENAGPAAALEQALAEDDLAQAAGIVAGLDEAGRAALGDWPAGLSARLAVRQALTQQSAALAAAGDRP